MLEHDDMSQLVTLVDSLEHLPIASRFLSLTCGTGPTILIILKKAKAKVPEQLSMRLASDGRGDLEFFIPEHDPRSPQASRETERFLRVPFPFPFPSISSIYLPVRKRSAVSTASFGSQVFCSILIQQKRIKIEAASSLLPTQLHEGCNRSPRKA
jgi:hypothetical protein